MFYSYQKSDCSFEWCRERNIARDIFLKNKTLNHANNKMITRYILNKNLQKFNSLIFFLGQYFSVRYLNLKWKFLNFKYEICLAVLKTWMKKYLINFLVVFWLRMIHKWMRTICFDTSIKCKLSIFSFVLFKMRNLVWPMKNFYKRDKKL